MGEAYCLRCAMIYLRARFHSLATFLTLAWIGGLLLPAWLVQQGLVGPALGLYQSFSLICHQIPERSWQFSGAPLAVCSRCTAIYVGVFAGVLISPLIVRRGGWRSRWWLGAALLPMLVDVGLDWLGLVSNTFTTRSVTGGLFGVAVAIYLYPELLATWDEWRRVAPRPGESHRR